MRIGTLADRTGTNVPTIRYYESIGLLPQAARQEGRQRVYGERDVERLTFIRRCREFGFSVEQVRSLEALGRDRSRSCLELRELAKQTFVALDCAGLARVDFFVTPENKIYVNEINTMPGFTPVSLFPRMWAASGLPYPELVARLVDTALARGTGLR